MLQTISLLQPATVLLQLAGTCANQTDPSSITSSIVNCLNDAHGNSLSAEMCVCSSHTWSIDWNHHVDLLWPQPGWIKKSTSFLSLKHRLIFYTPSTPAFFQWTRQLWAYICHCSRTCTHTWMEPTHLATLGGKGGWGEGKTEVGFLTKHRLFNLFK